MTKRDQKRERANPHSCSLCEGMHPKVRRGHGYLTEQVRSAASLDLTLRWGSSDYYQRCVESLVAYERGMQQYHERCIEIDKRMRDKVPSNIPRP